MPCKCHSCANTSNSAPQQSSTLEECILAALPNLVEETACSFDRTCATAANPLPACGCNCPKCAPRPCPCGISREREYEPCFDCSGECAMYPASCRNCFWPSFAHPRWLPCAELYSGETTGAHYCCD